MHSLSLWLKLAATMKEFVGSSPWKNRTNSADIHMMLGSAFADQHEYDTALQQYRKSLAIDPVSSRLTTWQAWPSSAMDTPRTLWKNCEPPSNRIRPMFREVSSGVALIQIQQRRSPNSSTGVINRTPIARMLLRTRQAATEQGDTKGAVASLRPEQGGPDADYIHYQLAMAYRRDSREEDAQREIKLYQSLKNRNRGRGMPPI
jgi:tetratricopeptide (TPR) repeat protein